MMNARPASVAVTLETLECYYQIPCTVELVMEFEPHAGGAFEFFLRKLKRNRRSLLLLRAPSIVGRRDIDVRVGERSKG